jgi:hypothetical protein
MIRAHARWLAVAATLGAAMPAVGQEPGPTPAPSGDRWNLRVAPYLWAASMDGHASVGGIKADVDVPFSDLLKDLSGGAMLLVDVEKGRLGVGVNGLFARVSSDTDAGSIEIDTTTDTGQLAGRAVLPGGRLGVWHVAFGRAASASRCTRGRLPLHLHAH